MVEEIMTIDEVASYLKTSTRTVFRMLKAKEIPAFKMRGQWRFKKDEIDRFTAERYSSDPMGRQLAMAADSTVREEERAIYGSRQDGNNRTVDVPVVGKIACGAPVLAEENIEQVLPVSTSLAAGSYNYFILKAKGDSMNLAGINDGDYVLIRQQTFARPGDIVVALINEEATLKEYVPQGNVVVLKPHSSNTEHKPIILSRDLIIQGVVVTALPKI
jgi:SOS regulatory protein LexA